MITRKLGRKVRQVNINPSLAYKMVRGLQWVPGLPINDEQVQRLQEDKVFDISKAVAELGFSLRPFEEGISQEIEVMRRAGLV